MNFRSRVQILQRLLLKLLRNKFSKVIFLPKNYFSFAFCTFISVICYFIFHHQTISSWFKTIYPGVMSYLKEYVFDGPIILVLYIKNHKSYGLEIEQIYCREGNLMFNLSKYVIANEYYFFLFFIFLGDLANFSLVRLHHWYSFPSRCRNFCITILDFLKIPERDFHFLYMYTEYTLWIHWYLLIITCNI